jgi:hypothetical protein
MTEKAPVEKGQRFVSMRTGKEAVVERAAHHGTVLGWSALVLIDDTVRTWLTCSKDGIKGYRRMP